MWRLLALLLVVAPLCALYGIGRRDVVDVNEAQRLQPAIEMLERGDYIVPTLDGERYLSKPPLIYWIAAGAFRVAGTPSALAGRIPVAIACLLIAAALAIIGWRTAGARVGLWSAIVLLSAFYFRARARETELDPLLTGAVLGVVYGQWRAATRARWWRPAIAAGICAGLALLLKGPVLLLFLAASTIAIAVVERPAPRRMLAPLGVILGVGVALFLPWGIALLARVGAGELWSTLRSESLTRLTTATRINSGPPYFYVTSVGASFLPWSWLLPLWASRTLRRDLRASASSWLRVAGIFSVAALVIFSLVAGKETEYLLPIFPFLALLAAAALDWLLRADAPLARRGAAVGLGTWAALGACAPLLRFSELGRWLPPRGAASAMLVAGGAACAAALVLLARRTREGAAIALALGLTLVIVSSQDALERRSNAVKSPRVILPVLERMARGGTPVYRYGLGRLTTYWVRPHTTKLTLDRIGSVRAATYAVLTTGLAADTVLARLGPAARLLSRDTVGPERDVLLTLRALPAGAASAAR